MSTKAKSLAEDDWSAEFFLIVALNMQSPSDESDRCAVRMWLDLGEGCVRGAGCRPADLPFPYPWGKNMKVESETTLFANGK